MRLEDWEPIENATQDEKILAYEPSSDPDYPDDYHIACVIWGDSAEGMSIDGAKCMGWIIPESYGDEQGGYTQMHPTHFMRLRRPV